MTLRSESHTISASFLHIYGTPMQFIPLAPLLTMLGLMLSLSVMVERFMSVFGWVIDKLMLIKASTGNETVQKLTADLELAKRASSEAIIIDQQPAAATGPTEARDITPSSINPKPDSRFDVKLLDPPDQIRTLKEFWIQITANIFAVGACVVTKFSIWTLVQWPATVANPDAAATGAADPTLWGCVFTGIIIGAGSKPVRFLINFLVNRKVEKAREDVKISEAAPAPEEAAPVITTASPAGLQGIEELVGFVYDGGDRPERLENTHRRSAPVDLIVYHHTALHSSAPFAEVVKEFDRKGWLTGYHCVVMADGTIRPLCRWDRMGNHVLGYNHRSLGIALQGNFEPDPSIPFSNAGGSLGNLFPPPIQIDAAARITALWALLHNVKVTFPAGKGSVKTKGIAPHNLLAAKACPGGNFPHDAFQQSVRDYAARWKTDTAFMAALGRFALLPMVMEKTP